MPLARRRKTRERISLKDYKLDLEKSEEPEIKLPTYAGS